LFQFFNAALPKKKIEVKDWKLESCGTDHDGFQLQNINVVNSQEDEILVTGSVNVQTFLSAPITVRTGELAPETRKAYFVRSDLLCLVLQEQAKLINKH
jgi:hypothetical protein